MNARVRALAVLVAVFLFGASVGIGGYQLIRSKVSAVSSQDRPPSRDRGGPRLRDLLDLSPGQQAQFESIMKEFRTQFEAVRAEERKKLDPIEAEFRPKFEAVRAEMAPKFDAVRSEMNRRIASLLNEDQKKKFEAFQKEREGRGAGRHRPDRPGGPPDPR